MSRSSLSLSVNISIAHLVGGPVVLQIHLALREHGQLGLGVGCLFSSLLLSR